MAMALLLIMVTFVAGLFLHLFVASSKSLDSSIALEIADSVLTQANDSDPASWPALAQNQSIYNHDPRTPTQFNTVLTYSLAPVMAHDMGKMYEVSVEVYWMGTSPTQSRHIAGRQAVKLSKVVYVSDMKIVTP